MGVQMSYYVFEVNGQTYRRMSNEFKWPEEARDFCTSMKSTIRYKDSKMLVCKVFGDIKDAEALE